MARRARMVLPVVLVLATLALFVPWRTCGVCLGKSRPEARGEERNLEMVGWACPTCRDQGRTSLLTTLTRRAPSPLLTRVVLASLLTKDAEPTWTELQTLLEEHRVDPADWRNFQSLHWRFLDADGGRHFALYLTVGPQGGRAARVFLFDLDGALLDRIDVSTDDPQATVLAGFLKSLTDQGAGLTVSALYLHTSRAPQIPLVAVRKGRPDDALGTYPKGTLHLGIRDGRWRITGP